MTSDAPLDFVERFRDLGLFPTTDGDRRAAVAVDGILRPVVLESVYGVLPGNDVKVLRCFSFDEADDLEEPKIFHIAARQVGGFSLRVVRECIKKVFSGIDSGSCCRSCRSRTTRLLCRHREPS